MEVGAKTFIEPGEKLSQQQVIQVIHDLAVFASSKGLTGADEILTELLCSLHRRFPAQTE
jgi:hypothetical protein